MPLPRVAAGPGRPAGRSTRAKTTDDVHRTRRRRAAAACSAALAIGAATGQTALATTAAPARKSPPTGGATAPAALAVFESRLGLLDPTRDSLRRAAARQRAKSRARARARTAAGSEALVILRMIAAGNRIARLPYLYGGGHGSFSAAGYDCSGSVSYVLHGGGLLDTPLDSSGFESFGDPGPGRHVTVYANGGHALMTIDGRRFDTIAFQETGTRWSDSRGSTSGYVVRHPRGM